LFRRFRFRIHIVSGLNLDDFRFLIWYLYRDIPCFQLFGDHGYSPSYKERRILAPPVNSLVRQNLVITWRQWLLWEKLHTTCLYELDMLAAVSIASLALPFAVALLMDMGDVAVFILQGHFKICNMCYFHLNAP
jgi:hypothetical protein